MAQRELPLAPEPPVFPEWVEVLGVPARYGDPLLVPPLLELLQQHWLRNLAARLVFELPDLLFVDTSIWGANTSGGDAISSLSRLAEPAGRLGRCHRCWCTRVRALPIPRENSCALQLLPRWWLWPLWEWSRLHPPKTINEGATTCPRTTYPLLATGTLPVFMGSLPSKKLKSPTFHAGKPSDGKTGVSIAVMMLIQHPERHSVVGGPSSSNRDACGKCCTTLSIVR